MGDILGVAEFQIFFGGASTSWYVFGVNSGAWPEPTLEEKNENTPPPPGI